MAFKTDEQRKAVMSKLRDKNIKKSGTQDISISPTSNKEFQQERKKFIPKTKQTKYLIAFKPNKDVDRFNVKLQKDGKIYLEEEMKIKGLKHLIKFENIPKKNIVIFG